MLIDRTSPGEPEEGLHPETLVDQDIRDGEAFMLAGRPIAPKDIYDLPETVRELYKELLNNVDRSGMLLRDWRGFPAGTDADDVLRAIDGAFGETEYNRAGTVFGAYAANTFMSPFHVAEDAAHDVTPLTPWEDEDGVAFLSRTLDADAGATVPCLWYCMSGGEEGFEVGGVKLDCSKIGFDEVAAMLADAVGNRFNRQDIMKAILNGGDIHLDYWPEYGEYDYAARICGELLADTSLAWADGLIDPDKIKTHKGLTAGDLSHAVTCVLTDRFNDGLDEARLADCKNIADEFARAIESRLGSGHLGRALYVDGDCLRDDLTDKFGFSYDIDFSGLTFKTSLILSVNDLYYEGDVIDAARDWQEDYLPCVCHRGGQGEDDRWEYEPAEDYRPFTRPADIPKSIFDKLCASQGTTVEKVVNDPVTPFERSFREDIFNMPQNRPVGLAVLATLPLDAFLDASLSMICRGEGENAGTFTVKPGTYEPILGIYDPVGGCGGTMGTVLDCDFEIDPHDIAYTMMEPVRGEWKSDRIDLYTPQDCFGFSDPFGGRIEYSEKKPEIAVAVKPDPVELGHRASVAASSTAGGRARGAGIRQ